MTDDTDGRVVFRDGEETLADRVWTTESHVGYAVGRVIRKVPWDRVELVETFRGDPDDA